MERQQNYKQKTSLCPAHGCVDAAPEEISSPGSVDREAPCPFRSRFAQERTSMSLTGISKFTVRSARLVTNSAIFLCRSAKPFTEHAFPVAYGPSR